MLFGRQCFRKLKPSGDEGQILLAKLPRQPGGAISSAASNVANSSGGIVYAPIDPTRGELLKSFERVQRVPDTSERIAQGGTIGKIILILLGLNFLKLAAGIAPLLGLLGTVTGMIKTFQAMMIYGTGDPQLMAGGISEALVTTMMAGGISEALVTTMLGLIAAIPLLILHSFCSSLARSIQGTLEEQSAGIVARHVESRTGV